MQPGQVVDEQVIRTPVDMAVLTNDAFLFVDSSSRWSLSERKKALFESQPDGRYKESEMRNNKKRYSLFHYHVSTGKITLLTSGLYYPSGIALAHDNRAVFIAEAGTQRILKCIFLFPIVQSSQLHRHYIAGKNFGQTEMFFEPLPGVPGFIRAQGDDSLWVTIRERRLQ